MCVFRQQVTITTLTINLPAFFSINPTLPEKRKYLYISSARKNCICTKVSKTKELKYFTFTLYYFTEIWLKNPTIKFKEFTQHFEACIHHFSFLTSISGLIHLYKN